MKTIVAMVLMGCLSVFFSTKCKAQAQEIEQLVLDLEKLTQFKAILSDMKKGYEIVSGGYGTIKNLSEGNFKLHQSFLDGLMQVSPTVKNYSRVAEIVQLQLRIIKDCKASYVRFVRSNNFSSAELSYIVSVYDNLTNQCSRNLDQLLVIVTSGTLRMSDNERLKAIDNIYMSMQDKSTFLGRFNKSTAILSVQKSLERKNNDRLFTIYGLNKN